MMLCIHYIDHKFMMIPQILESINCLYFHKSPLAIWMLCLEANVAHTQFRVCKRSQSIMDTQYFRLKFPWSKLELHIFIRLIKLEHNLPTMNWQRQKYGQHHLESNWIFNFKRMRIVWYQSHSPNGAPYAVLCMLCALLWCVSAIELDPEIFNRLLLKSKRERERQKKWCHWSPMYFTDYCGTSTSP